MPRGDLSGGNEGGRDVRSTEERRRMKDASLPSFFPSIHPSILRYYSYPLFAPSSPQQPIDTLSNLPRPHSLPLLGPVPKYRRRRRKKRRRRSSNELYGIKSSLPFARPQGSLLPLPLWRAQCRLRESPTEGRRRFKTDRPTPGRPRPRRPEISSCRPAVRVRPSVRPSF